MFIFPAFNPIAFSVGPVHVHWYGIMYLLGFMSAFFLAKARVKHYHLSWTTAQIDDLIFYLAVGVIFGGRLGYMFFYNTQEALHHPWNIFKIWEGGMSFHGGLLGVMVAIAVFSRRVHKSFLEVTDFVIPLVPLGLAAGRMGNFINGELWGRITHVPWAMIFPDVDYQPRHPSQLYELCLEGLLLFIVIWWYAAKPRRQGCVSAVFLMSYAVCRVCVEFFRQPDAPMGLFVFNTLSMGQLLSVPMFLVGLWLYLRKNHAHLSESY